MTTPLDNAFFARDVHDHWAKRISAARESVWVLTPQVDETLGELLRGASVPEVVILTSIRPDVVGLRYREHLLGLRELLASQIDVRVTTGSLSANVLVCDRKTISAGSQSFTTAGRSADAVTLGPANSIDGSEFQSTLDRWLGGGENLDGVLVDFLIDSLDESLEALEIAQRNLVNDFDLVIADNSTEILEEPNFAWFLEPILWQSPLQESASGVRTTADGHLPQVAHGLRQTLVNDRRVSDERVFARLHDAGQYWDPYRSLVADSDADMTAWTQPQQDGSSRNVLLQRLRMYPVILNPSGRMGFARVGKTRITYVRQVVHWADSIPVAGVHCDLEVSFPTESFETSNLHLTLKPVDRSRSGILLKLRFDGREGVLHELVRLQSGDEIRSEVSSFSREFEDALDRSGALDELLDAALRPFRFKTLGRDRHNAETFFQPGPQEVRLFRFGARSVLAVSSLRD